MLDKTKKYNISNTNEYDDYFIEGWNKMAKSRFEYYKNNNWSLVWVKEWQQWGWTEDVENSIRL